MASERITRCNPFAYNYHLELNSPFNEKDSRLIDPVKLKTLLYPSITTSSWYIIAHTGIGRAYAEEQWMA